MTTDASIRPMRPADAPRVAELATQLGYPSTSGDVMHRFAELAEYARAVALVAVDAADDVIGWIQVERTPSLAVSDAALIGGLVVDEAHRSARVGAALLEAGEHWAREHGARTMMVSSRVAREAAHRFYEREGYERLKTSHIFARELV
ncbi:MAG TPA: GNAT family N-acetyltransferase [Candidatus Limnocylindria bacterium]|jgi:predicted N-acetyltransferase YhbS